MSTASATNQGVERSVRRTLEALELAEHAAAFDSQDAAADRRRSLERSAEERRAMDREAFIDERIDIGEERGARSGDFV